MLKSTILSDYKRCGIKKVTFWILLKTFLIMPNPGLKFMTIFRLAQHFRRINRPLFFLFFLWLRNLKVKYGFDISYRTKIGKGFYIGHFGNVVIHGDTVIGDNCNISQGITFGVSNSGTSIGVPTIGNNVFIGPGACVFGNICIGNNVTIGANAVVTNDVPDSHTVLSPSISVINKDLSSFYIHNSDT
ncbi:serine O-acetyltransferase [Flavobacterium sp. WC2430]|uniref:serine O-acetyltransferase n=1 Tax=Flavobacterium sp. WC2430 TaxID=3234137 RepID=UPI0034664119